MTITLTRKALIERLEKQLASAKGEDARKLAGHRKEESASLERFKKKLRSALEWDYATAKRNSSIYFERPGCPHSEAMSIERVLTMVKMDGRKVAYRISDNSDIAFALKWLPASKRPKSSLCD